MTDPADQNFADPDLQAALKRAWGAERAPESLRANVTKMLAQSEAMDASSAVQRPFTLTARNPVFGLAAAAGLLLAFGLVAYQLYTTSPTTPSTPMAATKPNVTLAMVSTHDMCCPHPDHHFLTVALRDDFGAIGKTIANELKRPVLAAALPDKSWTFKGASICPVGQAQSGHLIFHRAQQHISVFSLPASAAPTTNGQASVEGVAKGHPYAGFVSGEGFYCLVGSSEDGKLTTEELVGLRDQMKDQITAVARVPTVELLTELSRAR